MNTDDDAFMSFLMLLELCVIFACIIFYDKWFVRN